jgi:hypothetical protein
MPKRKLPQEDFRDTIDLTQDDDDDDDAAPIRQGRYKLPNQKSGSGRPPFPNSPSSSQPRAPPRSSQTFKDSTPYVSSQPWGSTQDQEADIAREIDLTEDFDDDVYENYMLYGILNTKIVGCRFYVSPATLLEIS